MLVLLYYVASSNRVGIVHEWIVTLNLIVGGLLGGTFSSASDDLRRTKVLSSSAIKKEGEGGQTVCSTWMYPSWLTPSVLNPSRYRPSFRTAVVLWTLGSITPSLRSMLLALAFFYTIICGRIQGPEPMIVTAHPHHARIQHLPLAAHCYLSVLVSTVLC